MGWLGSIIDAFAGNIQANNAKNTSLDLADKQHQYAVQDWNANNEYNSPAAQMGRFKAAGLNPNLIYGQMNNAAPIKSPDVSNPGMAHQTNFTQGEAAAAQNKIAKGQLNQNVIQSAATTELIKAQTTKALAEGKYADAQAAATLGQTYANTNQSQSNTALNEQSFSQRNHLFPFQVTAANLQNEKTASETQRNLQEVRNLFTDEEMNRVRTASNKAHIIQEIARSKAEMTKIPSEINLLKWTANSHEAKTMLDNLESDWKRWDLNQLGAGNATSHDFYPFKFLSPIQRWGRTQRKPYYK